MTAAVKGWHPGETRLQQKLGFADAVRDSWSAIKSSMSEQHRVFHTSNLHFIPITTLDDRGRPWGSLLAGENGSVGFATSPDETTLTVNASVWPGDPVLTTIKAFSKEEPASERFLIAGIGVEHATRRRNKFAGRLRGVQDANSKSRFDLEFEVTQALGNCPKYINVRRLIPHRYTHPSIAYQDLDMKACDRMPDQIIDFIKEADTVFLASIFKSQSSTKTEFPSHAGMNIRGGLPGFIRVNPSDGQTVVLPDYSGNRFMSSLGNITSTPLAGLTIIDFKTGDVLYLTGTAQVVTGSAAMDIMARQACLTVIKVTGYTFVRDALPAREEPGTLERSPYSPKIKFLSAQLEGKPASGTADITLRAQLTHATQFAHDIAKLRFEVINPGDGGRDLKIRPGQAIVLDFMDWIGPPVYQHMANDAPSSINDDRVRTWTVSSAHGDGSSPTTWFEMTMRAAPNGAVTGALFRAIDGDTRGKWEKNVPVDKGVVSDIVGVTGDFHLGAPGNEIRVLWVAGGIGVTPFMAMLAAITATGEGGFSTRADVVLALSTREPDVFLQLIKTSLPFRALPETQKVRIDIFTGQDIGPQAHELGQMNVDVVAHKGRIPVEYWPTVSDDRDVFICGPGEFGNAVETGLRGAGVPNDKIYREGFY